MKPEAEARTGLRCTSSSAKENARKWSSFPHPKETYIAALATTGIVLHLALRYLVGASSAVWQPPLYATLIIGGIPLVVTLSRKLLAGEFSSDLLAGLSILTAALLREYLVASLVVLMLSGGTALEQYATRRASSVLDALARRIPHTAHRKVDSHISEVELEAVGVGDMLVVLPHEICPVDGEVVEGHSVMDEAYLTGEPFEISKTPGSPVLSGAINGDTALTIVATKLAVDSRYAKITEVMQETEQKRPQLRRIGDRIGAWYAPAALGIAAMSWLFSGDPHRFLAVMVIATPCPLLLAIPVAVIGAISLAARRGIIVKDPAVLEQADTCRTLIFDKTGTLTYGKPTLTEIVCANGFATQDVLRIAASLEQYSKHPLAGAVRDAARKENLCLEPVSHISEKPGEGLQGSVAGGHVQITGRAKVTSKVLDLPPIVSGLECLVFVGDQYAAAFRFQDVPRWESSRFVSHLKPSHRVQKFILVSGDRESEVRNLAEAVGIKDVFFGKSPEEKVAIVTEETKREKTLFVGDGINDAPALLAATVGIALGLNSDITSEAAGAVIMDSSLGKVDEFFHISQRMRSIALQSAVGGMLLSALGMIIAAGGYLPPVGGAIAQEIIDVFAITNALRAALPPRALTDF